MQKITITQPDDWHNHFRDGDVLKRTVSDSAAQFARVIAMPNLKEPIDSFERLSAYYDRIKSIPTEKAFQPLMTYYLNNRLTAAAIHEGSKNGLLTAVKYYPAGVTTNSASGVESIKQMQPILDAMLVCDIPLLVHGETSDPSIDIFDREAHFIDHELAWLRENYPDLRIVMEHITTAYAADTVIAAAKNLAATITAHHLLIDRNDLLSGGIKPDLYCLPIAKRSSDREALIQAATSGSPNFFLGTDSAPHSKHNKYNACGCAGIYTALHAMPLYATAFEQAGALDKLEAFASYYGPDFYKLPRNTDTITMTKSPWQVPSELQFGDEQVTPFMAGQTLDWQVA